MVNSLIYIKLSKTHSPKLTLNRKLTRYNQSHQHIAGKADVLPQHSLFVITFPLCVRIFEAMINQEL